MGDARDVGPGFLGKHGFEYDIFFSYSHGDPNGSGDSALKRWSKQFNEALVQLLVAHLQAWPRIFLDESNDGVSKTARLHDDISRKVKSSALFHLIMSPQYLRSEWCAGELAAFVSTLPGEADSVDGRVFISKAGDTAHLDWPAALRDDRGNKTVGWLFHERGSPVPYGIMKDWRRGVPDEVEKQLLDLASNMAQALRTLDADLAQLAEKTSKTKLVDWLARGDVERIYLYGRTDEEQEWEATWKEIDKLGIEVMPNEPEALDAEQDSQRWQEYARLASRCDAMVMVAADAVKLDFDLDVIGRERRNLVHSKYKKYLPCAVLDRVGNLARPIRVDRARRFDIDWIDAHACDWPDYIRVWLQNSADKARRRYGLSPDSNASDANGSDSR